MVEQGYERKLVATVLAISRSSLYYRMRPRGSRADRRWDSQIVAACGTKPAYGSRRVTWWLRRKEGLLVNRKRVLRVMREQGLLVPSRRLRSRRRKEWGRVEASRPNQIWQADLTKIWAGSTVGGQSRRRVDPHYGQRHAIHFYSLPGNPGAAGDHASAHGVSSPGRKQLHRALSSQLEGRRSRAGRISKSGRGPG
jgi:HTH-like domain